MSGNAQAAPIPPNSLTQASLPIQATDIALIAQNGVIRRTAVSNLAAALRGTGNINIQDYGADPIGDGMFRMVPSGDVVDYAERCKRLGQ